MCIEITPRQIEILNHIFNEYVKKDKKPNKREMSRFFKISHSTAQDICDALIKKGYLENKKGVILTQKGLDLYGDIIT